MRERQIISVALICAWLFFMQGCVAVLVGAGAAGTVAYVKGKLAGLVDKDIDKVYPATLKALNELEISPTKKEKDSLSAVIVGRTVEDKKITIKLKAAENNLTKISIKIGVFGNQTQSRLIYDEIKKHL